MYECSICLALNHASRLHCQCCGAVPAVYSLTGKVVQSSVDAYPTAIEMLVAHGCVRSERRMSKVGLKTVPLTYYAKE